MKPDWDKLMEEFENSTSIKVADVDCTASGEQLCAKHMVQKYPTIKYGDPTAPVQMKIYDGPRKFYDMKNWIEWNLELEAPCSLHNLDACSPEDHEILERYSKLTDSQLEETANRLAESEVESEKEAREIKIQKTQALRVIWSKEGSGPSHSFVCGPNNSTVPHPCSTLEKRILDDFMSNYSVPELRKHLESLDIFAPTVHEQIRGTKLHLKLVRMAKNGYGKKKESDRQEL